MRRATTVVTAAATSLLLAAAPAAAHEGGGPAPEPPAVTELATGLVTPLSLAAGPRGTTFVTQNFAGLLTAVDKGGAASVLYASTAGEEVGGVSYHHRTVTFTETEYAGEMEPSGSTLRMLRLDRHGNPAGPARTVADIRAYENAHNPDGAVTYGLRDTDQACLDQIDVEGFAARYPGITDSHPYATTRARGATYVADAGMNAVLSVSDRGHVRTVAVLPAQPAEITADLVAAQGLPECLVGETYWFEPVPTDVESGPRGQLYVSTLPGGPEDASLGARGKVYTVDPRTGHVREVASGLVSATDVAVSPRGALYVAELFGGRISQVRHGAPHTVVETGLPGAVEWSGGDLLATVQVLGEDPEAPPAGTLVRVDLPGGHGHDRR